MTDSDWQRSEAYAHMMRARDGIPMPFKNFEVMIDAVLHVFFVNVNGRLLTTSEVMIEGSHATDERRDDMRKAYRALKAAKHTHAERLGFGRAEKTEHTSTGVSPDHGRTSSGSVHHRDRVSGPNLWAEQTGDHRAILSGDHVRDDRPTAKRSNISRRQRNSKHTDQRVRASRPNDLPKRARTVQRDPHGPKTKRKTAAALTRKKKNAR